MATKEEKFLIAIYKKIIREKPEEGVIDFFILGKELGYTESQSTQMMRLLAQSNLVRKHSSSELSLTEHGEELASKLANL